MNITGDIAWLSQAEQRAFGLNDDATFVAKLRCNEVLTEAKNTYDAIEGGQDIADYAPRDVVEGNMVGRSFLLTLAKRRLNIVTHVGAQVLAHETEQFLQAQANGTPLEGF